MQRSEEFQVKRERLCRFLSENGLGGAVLARTDNFAWLGCGARVAPRGAHAPGGIGRRVRSLARGVPTLWLGFLVFGHASPALAAWEWEDGDPIAGTVSIDSPTEAEAYAGVGQEGLFTASTQDWEDDDKATWSGGHGQGLYKITIKCCPGVP